MSNIDNKYDNFESAVRGSMEHSEHAPSAELWGKIEATMDAAKVSSPLLIALRWCGAVAASVAMVVAANSILSSNDNVTLEAYDAVIAEFVELPSTPIYIEPTKISPTRPMFVAQSVEEQDIEVVELSEDHIKEGVEQKDMEQKENPNINKESVNTSKGNSQGNSKRYGDVVVNEDFKIKRRRPLQLSMMVGGGAAATSTFAMAMPQMSCEVPSEKLAIFNVVNNNKTKVQKDSPSHIDHHSPISAALSAAYALNERWSVESGLNYTSLNSDVTTLRSSESIRQRVDFLGMPLRVNYHILSTPSVAIYSGVGGQIERCIYSKVGNETIKENPWHTSAEAAIGVQYNINRWLGIYTEPELTYYFTETKLTTLRTESPVSFNLNFGLRFTFGN